MLVMSFVAPMRCTGAPYYGRLTAWYLHMPVRSAAVMVIALVQPRQSSMHG